MELLIEEENKKVLFIDIGFLNLFLVFFDNSSLGEAPNFMWLSGFLSELWDVDDRTSLVPQDNEGSR